MRHSRFLLPLLFTAAVQLSAALPTDKKIELTAPKQDYDLQTNDAVFSGGAFLRYGDAVLTADEIRYNTNTEQATAIGQAVLTHQGTSGNIPLAAAFTVIPMAIMILYLLGARRLGAFDAL